MMGLLSNDKKKMVQLILSEAHTPKEKDVPQGLEGDFSSAMESFAKDIIEGVKSDDPGKVCRSLKNLIAMCGKEEEYAEPMEE